MRKILFGFAAAWLVSGCGFGPDVNGWHSSQKEEFREILKDDPYFSLCQLSEAAKPFVTQESQSSMTPLFIAYVKNLANSCIDMGYFNAKQKQKKSQEIKSYFDMHYQKVDSAAIVSMLKAGSSIKEILKPFIPTDPQFKRLIALYKKKKNSGASAALLHKIRINIERSKLSDTVFETNYILVNIPEYMVRVIEGGKENVKFGVVVGKKNMQTPIFSNHLTYIQINPQWNVPDSIMRKSYIPKIKANPGWVAAHGMELHKESYALSSPKVNPASVDWSKYPKEKKGYIPFKLVQPPSKKNGLGRVKFLFPNRHAVYMHDTQMKSLFKRRYRCYSHGCVRLSQPKNLLYYLASHYSSATKEEVDRYYDSLKSHIVKLNSPLQVHLLYYTVYVDEKGDVIYPNDPYRYDSIFLLKGANGNQGA